MHETFCLLAVIAAIAAAQEPDLAARLAGAWKREAADELMGFFGKRCVMANGTQQQLYAVTYGADRMQRRPMDNSVVLDTTVVIDGDRLTLKWEGGRKTVYTRLPEVPAAVLVDPFALGTRRPDEVECQAITRELRARGKRDQAIRAGLGKAMAAARKKAKSPEEFQRAMRTGEIAESGVEMRTIDADNTRYLAKLLQDVGWIDAARFGKRAARDAFLIVQHSGNLRLMQTALPRIEIEAKADPKAMGETFALLYDRTTIALGGKQRYGSQLWMQPDGSLRLRPLADPATVDTARAALGMEPLESYLDRFRRRGQKVHR